MLRIAIQSKGRLNEESLSLLQSIGIEVDAPKRNHRPSPSKPSTSGTTTFPMSSRAVPPRWASWA